MITWSRRRGARIASLPNSVSLKSIFSRNYAMIKWIKNRLSKGAPVDEDKENVAPVGVRVRPPEARDEKPADTYVAGYNVDEDRFGLDDDHATTASHIKTIGVDPYNSGPNDNEPPGAAEPVPKK